MVGTRKARDVALGSVNLDGGYKAFGPKIIYLCESRDTTDELSVMEMEEQSQVLSIKFFFMFIFQLVNCIDQVGMWVHLVEVLQYRR